MSYTFNMPNGQTFEIYSGVRDLLRIVADRDYIPDYEWICILYKDGTELVYNNCAKPKFPKRNIASMFIDNSVTYECFKCKIVDYDGIFMPEYRRKRGTK
jgi:hypothetical protein